MALILLCHEPELREGGPTTRCLDVTVRVRPYVAVNDNEWALYRLSVCPFVRLILTRNRIESQPRGMEGRRRDDRFHHHVDGWMDGGGGVDGRGRFLRASRESSGQASHHSPARSHLDGARHLALGRKEVEK